MKRTRARAAAGDSHQVRPEEKEEEDIGRLGLRMLGLLIERGGLPDVRRRLLAVIEDLERQRAERYTALRERAPGLPGGKGNT